MKRFLTALALTCVLSVSAMAGTIDTCGIKSEETTPETSASGNVPTSDSEAPAEDSLITILLSMLSMV